jgi:hypothetical protein
VDNLAIPHDRSYEDRLHPEDPITEGIDDTTDSGQKEFTPIGRFV